MNTRNEYILGRAGRRQQKERPGEAEAPPRQHLFTRQTHSRMGATARRGAAACFLHLLPLERGSRPWTDQLCPRFGRWAGQAFPTVSIPVPGQEEVPHVQAPNHVPQQGPLQREGRGGKGSTKRPPPSLQRIRDSALLPESASPLRCPSARPVHKRLIGGCLATGALLLGRLSLLV